MKLQTKKLLALLVTMAMCIGLVTVPVMAEDGTPITGSITIENPGNYYLAGDGDITGEISINTDGDVTIDLNGHNITCNSSTSAITVYKGNVEIKDTVGGAVVSNNLNTANAGTISVDDGTLTLNGGKYTQERSSTNCDLITVGVVGEGFGSTNAKLVINDGVTIEYARNYDGAVNCWAADIEINGGNISGNILNSWGSIEINGGNIHGNISQVDPGEGFSSDTQVKGGKYSEDPTAYVAEGYEVKSISETPYLYEVVAKATAVAKIGTTEYASLEEALEAAPSGATVTLIADIDYSKTYTKRNARDDGEEHKVDLKNVTLDMDSHTISTINATVVFGGNGATIQNGTFALIPKNTDGSNKDGSYGLIIDNSVFSYGATGTVDVKDVTVGGGVNVCAATVTLDNVTAQTTTTKFYAVWAEQDATLTINSGTYTDAQSGGKGVLATGTGNEGGAKIYVKGGTFNATNNLVYNSENNAIQITGGTFSKDPSEYVATGYEAVGINEGSLLWQVGKVKATELTPAAEAESGYEATYTATKSVVDSANQTIGNATENTMTVNVKLADEQAAKDTTVGKFELGDVVSKVVEATKTNESTINVEIAIERDNPPVVDNTITYEVHPVATTYVNSEKVSEVVIGNDALAQNASFIITLPVPDELAQEKKLKVTHKSEGLADEVGIYDVKGETDKYVEVPVTHFSTLTLSAVEAVEITDVDAFVHSTSGLGNIRFITTVNSDDTVTQYGTYFATVDDEPTIKASNAYVVGNTAGKKTTFGADIKNIDTNYLGTTIYAMSFIKVGDTAPVWSAVKGASVNEYNHNK